MTAPATARASAPLKRDPGSYRDPHNGILRHDGRVLRHFDEAGWAAFTAAESSGVLTSLLAEGLLLPYRRLADDELPLVRHAAPAAVGAIEHPQIPFLSYPYEWTFHMLRDAALLHLEVLDRLAAAGFVLKDGQADNVQFIGARPVFIDLGSIEPYRPGTAWAGYSQFCATFLAPLLIESMRHIPFQPLLRGQPTGIDVATAARLLPWRSRLRRGAFFHVHLHAWLQRRVAESPSAGQAAIRGRTIDAHGVRRQVRSLRKLIEGLRPAPPNSGWADYAPDASYGDEAREAKRRIVAAALADRPERVWDVGANTGEYSDLALERAGYVVAMDAEPAAVDALYRRSRAHDRLLPLVQDITNPSPDQGWGETERRGLRARGPADLVLWLALSHHLALSHAVPLERQVAWVADVARVAVFEFVPLDDPLAQRLIAWRDPASLDPRYSRPALERALHDAFATVDAVPLPGSGRVLYTVRR